MASHDLVNFVSVCSAIMMLNANLREQAMCVRV